MIVLQLHLVQWGGSYANGVGQISPVSNRLFGPAEVRIVPLKTHGFKDFSRTLTGF